MTSQRAEVHYYIAHSIIFCVLEQHCYLLKQAMNTTFSSLSPVSSEFSDDFVSLDHIT